MKTTEVRKLVSQSSSRDWLNTIEIPIEYKTVGFKQTFKGVSAFHKFLSQQVDGWEKVAKNLPEVFNNSKQHFSKLKSTLDGFIQSHSNQNETDLQNRWNQQRNTYLASNPNIFVSDCAETKFIISVNETQSESIAGAYAFIVGTFNFNNHDNFIGALLAYEFRRSEYPKLKYRKLGEIESFKDLISNFKTQISDGETQLTQHLSDASAQYEEYVTQVDDFKTDKEKLVTSWFDESKNGFDEFTQTSEEKIKDLEDLYEKKLQLEKPAQYWSALSAVHKKQGWIAFWALLAFVVLVVIMLGGLLWNAPDQIYASFFSDDKSTAIRWSIIFITFISFMAYCVRAIAKVMFSSFHLSRDCQERHTLTYFYLALLKGQEVKDEERQLIMQSLFSRADTGLLKDDGSPTMPNDMAGKLFGKK